MYISESGFALESSTDWKLRAKPDEGTTVRIRIPYIPYTPDMQEYLDGKRMKPLKGETENGKKIEKFLCFP